MPSTVTARELHLARSAPVGLGMRQAIHWARIHLLGGGEALLAEALASQMIRHFHLDALWSRLLEKVAVVRGFDPRGLGLIVDTLVAVSGQADGRYAARLVSLPLPALQGYCARYWEQRLVAAEKDGARFGNRDVLVANLRAELRHLSTADWEPMEGVAGFRTPDPKCRTSKWRWTIQELCNHTLLLAEGRAMRHCVGSYRKVCVKGQSAIFSVCRQRMDEEGSLPERCLTLEVRHQSRMIVQARGPWNRLPFAAERQIIGQWAAQNGLTMAS
ncbi:MAG: PcfJ domain-containing protein [Luteolibacter sp.]